MLYKGDKFRTEFAQIGEIRCIIPARVNVMALTATATHCVFKKSGGMFVLV